MIIDRKNLLSSKWMRVLVFLWLVVFPVMFIVVPIAELAVSGGTFSWETMQSPVWAAVLWLLTPFVGSIVLKNLAKGRE